MSAAAAASGNRAVADEEQNAPVAILDHRLDQRARQVERTVKNHAPDQLPIRVGGFSERRVWPDRSIVDQDVDPAKLGQRPGGQRLDLGLFADVGEYRDRFDPKIPGLSRDGLSLLPIGARVDHDMRALAGQLQHGRSTDIAPRSGDQRDLPFELAHTPITPTMLASDAASRLRCGNHLYLRESGRACSRRLHRAWIVARSSQFRKLISIGSTQRASCPSATSWQCINASAGSYHLTKWHRPTGLRRCSITSAGRKMSRSRLDIVHTTPQSRAVIGRAESPNDGYGISRRALLFDERPVARRAAYCGAAFQCDEPHEPTASPET